MSAVEEAEEDYKALLAKDASLRRWFQNNAKGGVIVA
jgi:hypothetical protein